MRVIVPLCHSRYHLKHHIRPVLHLMCKEMRRGNRSVGLCKLTEGILGEVKTLTDISDGGLAFCYPTRILGQES